MADRSASDAGRSNAVGLSIVLGSHPHTKALKRGDLRSPRLALDFVEMKPTNTAFKPMVREQRYDACEMAIVTFLQAKEARKPILLLPALMLCRFQHAYAFYHAERGKLTPADLHGKRVGVRAFTQTTGAWVRGILQQEYGVDWRKITWVTFEEPHVAEYRDPPNVVRAPEGKKLKTMLLEGEIDAAMGEVSDDARLPPLIPDPKAAAEAWYQKYRTLPTNHFVVVKESLARAKPWILPELYGLLKRGKAEAGLPAPGTLDMLPFGIEANRRSLEMIVEFALEQDLIKRRFTVDELFDDQVREFAGTA
jgi:4,5-dihydroxyphthalate decarboxylase